MPNPSSWKSLHQKSRPIIVVCFCSAVVVAVAVTVGPMRAFGTDGATTTFVTYPPTASTIVDSGDYAYPSSLCSSADPASLLIPVSTLPGMALETPIIAFGGQPLNTLGVSSQQSESDPAATSALKSVAVISEHFANTGAPASALQSEDPFNLSNPEAITSVDETLTGFSSSEAQGSFYSEAAAPQIVPQATVNGVLTEENVSSVSDVSSLPSPNEVVTISLQDTDVPAQIEITMEFGSTVLGLNFYGGSSLTLASVLGYAQSAVSFLDAGCPGGDIMAQ